MRHLHIRRIMVISCLMISSLLLSACATRHIKPPLPQLASGALKESYYQMRTTAKDGVTLSFTVYQPKLLPSQTAPLIVHTHGFGLSRMKRPWLDIYGSIMPTGEAAERAWHRGYWVISFDQRGHGGWGGSGGIIRVTDPEKEAQDVRTLLDWAEQNLPQLARNQQGVRVGMVGESYAGGIQYVASALDKRIQAIVPFTTWYDLESSLAPNGVAKSGWIGLLNLVGDWWNWNKLDPVLKQAYQDTKKGYIGAPTYELLKTHQARWFCETGQPPQADALIIQGFRDILFPFNEGIKAANCLKQAQRDVRVIGVDGGHLQLFAQSSPGLETPVWYVSKKIACNKQQLVLQDVIANWFDHKLKDSSADISTIPELCIQGSPISSMAQLNPQQAYAIAPQAIYPTRKQPVFIPLQKIQYNQWLTGIPQVQLSLSALSGQPDPTVFISLATQKAGSSRYHILNEQSWPLNLSRLQQRNQVAKQFGYPVDPPNDVFNLPAVNSKLNAGETLGLLINSSSPFYASSSKPKTAAHIEGSIKLPALLDAP